MRRIHHKSRGFSFLTSIICIAFVVVAVLCVTRFNSIMTQKARLTAEAEQLKAQEEELTEKLKALEAEERLGTDTDHVKSIARRQLDMVFPGEIIFRTNGE